MILAGPNEPIHDVISTQYIAELTTHLEKSSTSLGIVAVANGILNKSGHGPGEGQVREGSPQSHTP